MQRAGVGTGASDAIDSLIKEKLKKVDQELDRTRAIKRVAADRAASSGGSSEDQSYWLARRCSRISPISGTGSQLWANAGAFFYEKMLVPQDLLQQKHVVAVERVSAGKRKSKVQDEVIVTY